MKRPWFTLVIVSVIGLLAGVAVAGAPSSISNDVRIVNVPATSSSTVPTTTPTTTPATTTTDATASSTGSPAESTTTVAVIDRADIRVVAANAAKVTGAASQIVARLKALGYVQVERADAIDKIASSIVYARAGFEAQAELVASDLGLAPTAIRAYPGTPVTSIDDAGDVIVAIGPDLVG